MCIHRIPSNLTSLQIKRKKADGDEKNGNWRPKLSYE